MSRLTALALAALCVLAAAGCSAAAETYNNDPKPPARATISVFVADSFIAVSPKAIGGGPTRFVIGNKASVDETIDIEGVRASHSVMLAPGDTNTFVMTTIEGPLTIDASNTTADAVQVAIGPERPTAQNDLDQP